MKEVEKYKRKEEKISQLKALLEECDGEVVALKHKVAAQKARGGRLTNDFDS